VGAQSFGFLRVFPLSSESPPNEPDYEVLLVGMSEQIDGLYAVTDLATLEDLPRNLRARKLPLLTMDGQRADELVDRARVVLRGRDARLDEAAQTRIEEGFALFAAYTDFSVYARKL
jgi:hypothetical protein